ncbi:MAG: hypothetical protein CMI53_00480 [Parcubacteria group bacterium]|jgi:hypothetical protein|nr:hypothetical protein [Parcubacteria group bacterium]|tara:strand:- start:1620 stop:2165 length:546 start_codon:yes stop_codon:yes gene_type:complete
MCQKEVVVNHRRNDPECDCKICLESGLLLGEHNDGCANKVCPGCGQQAMVIVRDVQAGIAPTAAAIEFGLEYGLWCKHCNYWAYSTWTRDTHVYSSDCDCFACKELTDVANSYGSVTIRKNSRVSGQSKIRQNANICPKCSGTLVEWGESSVARKKGLIITHWSGQDDWVKWCPACQEVIS